MASKRLTLFDCVAIGVNGIIGSGIFLLPGWIASGAKALSPLAFVACGLLCALVALCYAEVGGMFDKSGGTYLYAREAFGKWLGFGVGWLVLVSAILGYATIARGLGEQISQGLGIGSTYAPPTIAASIIVLLGFANWRGIKTGARTSDALTLVKVGALVLFAVVGLFFVNGAKVESLGNPSIKDFGEGMFSCLFALSGFEFVAVVAGDADKPRRTIPLAIVGSLLGAVVLYALIQLVVVGVLPNPSNSRSPMVDAAAIFGGSKAAAAVRIASIISMIGFCSGSALVAPRLFASLAKDGVLPRFISHEHPIRGTPTIATFLVTGLALTVVFLSFKNLADLTVVTLFAQYVPTCLALILFRYKRPGAPRQFRVPFGVTIPIVAVIAMAFLIQKLDKPALELTGAIFLIGVAVIVLTTIIEKRPTATKTSSKPS